MDRQTRLSKEFKTFTKYAKAYLLVKVCVCGGGGGMTRMAYRFLDDEMF